jgi:hypothetical protein
MHTCLSDVDRDADPDMTDPSAVVCPEMRTPHRRFRWQCSDGDYSLWSSAHGTEWALISEFASRQEAVDAAKAIKRSGGTHPFRSVTQLVSKSFPIRILLATGSQYAYSGGPGHGCSGSVFAELWFRVEADETCSLAVVGQWRWPFSSWDYKSDTVPMDGFSAPELARALPLAMNSVRVPAIDLAMSDPDATFRLLQDRMP